MNHIHSLKGGTSLLKVEEGGEGPISRSRREGSGSNPS